MYTILGEFATHHLYIRCIGLKGSRDCKTAHSGNTVNSSSVVSIFSGSFSGSWALGMEGSHGL